MIAIVGGLGGFDAAVATLEDAFGNWAGQRQSTDSADLSLTNVRREEIVNEIPGKSQADLAAGITTIPRLHPDFLPLDVNLVLGRLGLMGRLGAEVRDRQGLAYYVFQPDRAAPRWHAVVGAGRRRPGQRGPRARWPGIQAQFQRLPAQSLVLEKEFADARSYLVGVLPLALESHDGVAATLLSLQEYGLGLDYLDRYPGMIAGLTREHILRAAAEHLDPERLVISVARPG